MNRILAALAGLATLVAPAAAADTQSTYTEINLNDCLIMHADDFGASFACPGWKGMPLYVAEGDLRFFVSYGFGAPDELAARQTLPQFNYVHSTLEWRLSNETGDWRPFATILRWYIDNPDSDTDSSVLVVTKIEPGNTCHVAYIDTSILAMPGDNHNEIARLWADNLVPDFDCATDDIHLYPS